MIANGLFGAQLNKISEILDGLGLLEDRQTFPNTSLGASDFKGLPYRGVYETAVKESAYDFRLADQSLVIFRRAGEDRHNGELSYSYLECPVEVMPFREFVASQVGIPTGHPTFEHLMDQWGDELRPEYEQYALTLEAKHVVTPIRYDYVARDYKPGRHPASHVHFGFKNEIRVGTNRIMLPISFLLFILRQRYPEQWVRFCAGADAVHICRNVRQDLDTVDDAYRSTLDNYEIALH